jgi:hypothetical protein
MKLPIRSLLPLLFLVFFTSACMGEPVELIDSSAQNSVQSNNDQRLAGTAPVISPVEADTPASNAPIIIATPQAAAVATVEATVLNVREGPDTSFPIITSVQQGEKLEVLGQYQMCDWLRVHTRSGEMGWVKSGAGFANYTGDCLSVPSGPFRPLNGTLVYDRRNHYGPGLLTVQNHTPHDGLVVITTLTNDPRVGFYIRSMENFTLTGLDDGEFLLFFTYGNAWDGNSKKFMVTETIKKMDQTLDFYSDDTGYTTWTLELSSLGGAGSASASDIPASAFPGLN